MAQKIFSGNAKGIGEDHGQWIIGDFMKEQPELISNCVEVKWSKHKKGERKPEAQVDKKRFTVTILVYGRFKQIFPNDDTEIIQENEGDLVYFAPEIKHKWEALEDSLMVTIRSEHAFKCENNK